MDIFQQTSFADTTNKNRCFLYNTLDRDFTMAKYLNTITIQSNRKAMAQLRLSSHKLMIERGRWKKIVHKERTCLHCQVLEDKYHVLLYVLSIQLLENNILNHITLRNRVCSSLSNY